MNTYDTTEELPFLCNRQVNTLLGVLLETVFSMQRAEVIQNHENEHVHGIGEGETRHRKYKMPKLGGGQAYDR
jgi:hypothetical protein